MSAKAGRIPATRASAPESSFVPFGRDIGDGHVHAGERAGAQEPVVAQLPLQGAESEEEEKQAQEPAPVSTRTHSLDGFVRDSSELLDKHRKSIDALALSISLHLGQLQNGTVAVAVTGHTDTTGTDKYNTGLGLRRAEAAKAELELALRKHQVPDAQIEWIATVSMGERRLAVPTKDEVDKPANRRVEFEVTISAKPVPGAPGAPPLLVPPILTPTPGPLRPTREALERPKIPALTPPSREWLKGALEDDKLLRLLPDAAREKAIDALKDVDETVAEKVIDSVPWDDKTKAAAKAAIRSILQVLKGRKFTPPPEPPSRRPEWGPERTFPRVPGEKIFTLPPIKFNWP